MDKVILIGNPNTGKTTLFNSLTNGSEHVGNWHGVTVGSKEKIYTYKKKNYNIVDLPGVYSLTPLSFEEEIAIEYLYLNSKSLIVNIVDINNLYRNLYLTLELISAGFNVILVVNKTSKNSHINVKKLQEKLNVRVLEINAENVVECEKLKEEIYNELNNKNIKNNKKILKNAEKIEKMIKKTENLVNFNNFSLNLNKEYISKKCLENDEYIIKKLKLSDGKKEQLKKIQSEISLDEIVKNTYSQIDLILDEKTKNKKVYGKSKLDKIVLNKYLCLPIFLLSLLAIFYLTFFSVGAFLSDALSVFVQDIFGEWILGLVKSITSSEIIYDFFYSAIIGGLGSIVTFLPQVVILFLCLGILEDSGYLSRVAFSLDDIFSKVGLSGKSVYTLLMGFGCSTSACLTARTMENKNSQIKTAMLAPYMSCSAKLPIYTVIGSAFFGASNVFIIFAMYLLGVFVALVLSVFYEKTFLKSGKQSFILELPPYRLTKPKRLLKLAWVNIKQFIIRIGSLLLSINIIVWVFSSFSFGFSFVKVSGGESILETLGRIISPIFAPLGFNNWGASSALVAGLIAKEIIVSTIAMINGVSTGGDLNGKVSASLTTPASAICFTPASALSYMVFCLLYSPCLATMAVLKKEVGKKWMIISIFVQFVIAYGISFFVYNSVNLIMNKGIGLFIILSLVFFLCCFSFIYAYKVLTKKRACSGCFRCRRK